MQLYRLSGRKVCERVKQKGFLWKGEHFQARMLRGLSRTMPESSPAGLYIGVLTSTKLHKSAVKRNRMRRRCREAMRVVMQGVSALGDKPREATGLAGPVAGALQKGGESARGAQPLSRSVQLLLLPRSSSLSAPFDELLADAGHLIASL